MKTKYLLLVIAGLMLCLFSCKKGGDTIDLSSIAGKWNIVSDSTYVGAGLSNHPVDYSGHPGDYFNFMANGIVYTKEGAILDTLNYTLVADTGMIISAFGLIANGVPSISHVKFTGHSLVIASPLALTPGGIFGRKVTLTR